MISSNPMSLEEFYTDESDEDTQQVQQVAQADDDPDAVYAGVAARLDTESLMLLVAERLSTSRALRAIVEDTKRAPFTGHDRRTLHVSDSMRLGDAVAAFLADAMDEQVEDDHLRGGQPMRKLYHIGDQLRVQLGDGRIDDVTVTSLHDTYIAGVSQLQGKRVRIYAERQLTVSYLEGDILQDQCQRGEGRS